MSAVPHPSLFIYLGVGVLALWRMYSRVRRMIGRQKFSNVRPWVTIVVFPLLIALLLLGSHSPAINNFALLGGAVCGVLLGVLGLRLTQFERTPEGLFYTPSAHLGIALSLAFFGRLVYRMIQLYVAAGQRSPAPPTSLTGSPLTLSIFGTLAGYYVAYAIGLLLWRRRVVRGDDFR